MSSAAYQPVSLPNGLSTDDEEEFQDEPQADSINSRIEPLEMGNSEGSHHRHNTERQLLSQVNDETVWPHLALAVTTWLVCPVLVLGMVLAYRITDRVWPCTLFALHLTLALFKATCHLKELYQPKNTTAATTTGKDSFPTSSYSDNETAASEDGDEEDVTSDGVSRENTGIPPSKGFGYFCITSLPSLMDIVLFGGVYPIINAFFHDFFVDYDGTLVYDWTFYYHCAQAMMTAGWIVLACRLCFGGRMLLVRIPASTYYLTTTYFWCQSVPVLGPWFRACYYRVWIRIKIFFSTPPRPLACWKIFTWTNVVLSTLFLGCSIYSLVIHVAAMEEAPPDASLCDPLDNTECCLPFPSNFHTTKDPTTDTGYRVNLSADVLPSLRGRLPIDVDFLNRLDGFSTMGPMLFYMEGMKESHETYKKKHNSITQTQAGVTRLRGHQEIELSITPYSTTLLLDVEAKALVPHSAEIDYLDPLKPLVMVFPAKPLKHNTHYAVAVINATDASGNRLPPTPGMVELWEGNSGRKVLYETVILKALERATSSSSKAHDTDWGGPFGSFSRKKDPGALQLLFDFRTISEKSQLGPVRAVRDGALNQIKQSNWNWDDHSRLVRQVDGDCKDPGYPLARTIHGEVDVPWFLSGFGQGFRGVTLDASAVETGVAKTIGKAKFVVYVPCSLKNKALNQIDGNAQPLSALLEYGHGLFNSRDEAADDFMIKMADRNGFVLTAMDWRGMSKFDYPLILQTMLSKPSNFESIRDNLIQGYTNKYAFQHFSQNGMLEREWFQFSNSDSSKVFSIPQDIVAKPISNQTQGEASLPSLFYGISQGGILGAGYVALSGATGLITRGALNVPGTSFSLILSRSLQFLGYDIALLRNFYNNRDVRIFLSLAQMCWDSVEGAGVLGQPVQEPIPPILLQAGLGDPIVSTLSAERLARALDASILPHNPRAPIFGLPSQSADKVQKAVLTEFKYQEEYDDLPLDDELTKQHWNNVHLCTRLEPVLQEQLDTFLMQGKFSDPCETPEMCVKKRAEC